MPGQSSIFQEPVKNMMQESIARDAKRAVLPCIWMMLAAMLIFSGGLGLLLKDLPDFSSILELAKTNPTQSLAYLEQATRIGFSLSGGLGFIGVTLALLSLLKRQAISGSLVSTLEEDRTVLEPRYGSPFWIAFAAALGLYLELMIVRMHGNFLQLFAYYKNVSLMSCFLGLGIGYSLDKKKPLTLGLFLPLMSFEIIFLNVLRWADLSYLLRNPAKEQATFETGVALSAPDMMISLGFIVGMFIFNALLCLPLGQLASQLMSKKSSLFCYGWNLVGSLIGVALFALLSFLWMPPAIWMAVAAIGVLLFLKKERSLLPSVVAACLAVAILAIPPRPFLFKPMKYDVYSPYQILTVSLEHTWPKLLANNTWLQQMVDLSPYLVAVRDDLKPIAAAYGLPYLYKPKPNNVLIVGSGTGNDVAAAIRGGASDIDAVEIDPGIIQIGSSMHPENPYQYSRVHIINDDARHYIRHSKKKYDLIVYGYLDSTSTLTANSGGVRMDSYVWTQEGFREARALLKPDGIISCSVCILPQLTQKVFNMLRTAFDGHVPIVYETKWDSGFTFIIANDLNPAKRALADDSTAHGASASSEQIPFKELTENYLVNKEQIDVATDDWPFLWMFNRSYPVSYAMVIALLTAISSFMVYKFLPTGGASFSWPCFFLGAGFMLVETKGITELALVWGSTWFVTSIVVAAVIVLAFLANLYVIRAGNPPTLVNYLILFLSLGAGYYLSYSHTSLAFLGGDLERIVMTVLLTMPLFFSGLAFSSELKRDGSIAVALSSNLLGGMVGGFVEYNSLYFGYRSLYLFALAMYVLAMVFALKKRSA